ncbi:MAG: aromatic-ring-hydroxylating dioxygenase subunit beta [Pseudomonadota bacterium]
MTALTMAPPPTQAVIDRYDDVRALVDDAMTRGPSTHAEEVTPIIECEARFLDAGEYQRWLDLYDDDACLWVPAHVDDHPGRDQALAFDDKRRLRERAWHMHDPEAWAITHPRPVTLRALGQVAAWSNRSGFLAVAPLTITHVRRGPAHILHGRQVLELTQHGLIRTKALLFPQLALGAPHLGWLM